MRGIDKRKIYVEPRGYNTSQFFHKLNMSLENKAYTFKYV